MGGPTFSRGGGGSNFFQGVQMLISIETHRTFDFPGGVLTPIPPSGSAHEEDWKMSNARWHFKELNQSNNTS